MSDLFTYGAHEAGHVLGALWRQAHIVRVHVSDHGGETKSEGSYFVHDAGDRRRHHFSHAISLAAGDAGGYLYASTGPEVTSAHDLDALRQVYADAPDCRATYRSFEVFQKMMFRAALGGLLAHRDLWRQFHQKLPTRSLALGGDLMSWGAGSVKAWIGPGVQDWEPTMQRYIVQGHDWIDAQRRV